MKTGHLVPGIPLERVKKQLAEIKGALVECPLVFLLSLVIEQKLILISCRTSSSTRRSLSRVRSGRASTPRFLSTSKRRVTRRRLRLRRADKERNEENLKLEDWHYEEARTELVIVNLGRMHELKCVLYD